MLIRVVTSSGNLLTVTVPATSLGPIKLFRKYPKMAFSQQIARWHASTLWLSRHYVIMLFVQELISFFYQRVVGQNIPNVCSFQELWNPFYISTVRSSGYQSRIMVPCKAIILLSVTMNPLIRSYRCHERICNIDLQISDRPNMFRPASVRCHQADSPYPDIIF